MDITKRTSENCLVLDCVGRITVGPDVMTFRNTVRDEIRSGSRQIVLNLASVDYVDTTGLGEMISCLTHIQSLGGKLVLLNPSKKISYVLEITKLSQVFEIYHEEKTALESLSH
jgi:anti-sigma B factor antagonist